MARFGIAKIHPILLLSSGLCNSTASCRISCPNLPPRHEPLTKSPSSPIKHIHQDPSISHLYPSHLPVPSAVQQRRSTASATCTSASRQRHRLPCTL
ncbi:hypothetical protein BKA58DRAFT_147304 [Alternaria rosae]|uniref:uncharacterized protein n=1 Tax=Alternaria rosae TaxID=1187941 RepID=UPI001E8D5D62|nr:uncharacterized protein BKA58DRAFT_147304 [Alternaria rosae]KAH6872513.1 hypothetical protein BKA58DRAFT_147304 [Alternaria rosae]